MISPQYFALNKNLASLSPVTGVTGIDYGDLQRFFTSELISLRKSANVWCADINIIKTRPRFGRGIDPCLHAVF
jgi:hypothetical protein